MIPSESSAQVGLAGIFPQQEASGEPLEWGLTLEQNSASPVSVRCTALPAAGPAGDALPWSRHSAYESISLDLLSEKQWTVKHCWRSGMPSNIAWHHPGLSAGHKPMHTTSNPQGQFPHACKVLQIDLTMDDPRACSRQQPAM